MAEPCKEAKELAEQISPNNINGVRWLRAYYEQRIRDPLAQAIQAVIDKAKEKNNA